MSSCNGKFTAARDEGGIVLQNDTTIPHWQLLAMMDRSGMSMFESTVPLSKYQFSRKNKGTGGWTDQGALQSALQNF